MAGEKKVRNPEPAQGGAGVERLENARQKASVELYGNLENASHGETVHRELGSGNGSASYKTGDNWLIPKRAVSGEVTWPQPPTQKQTSKKGYNPVPLPEPRKSPEAEEKVINPEPASGDVPEEKEDAARTTARKKPRLP